MTLEEQYASVKEAIQNHALTQLVLGKDKYAWENLKHIPAKVPSDISAILKNGLYKLYQESLHNVPELLSSTIVKLSQGTPIEIWTAYSIVWYQYRNELTGISPFKIVSQKLLNVIRTSIYENKAALAACNEFVGENSKNGLLEDIIASNNSLQRKFEVSIL